MRLKRTGLTFLLIGITSLSLYGQTLFKFGKHKVSKQEFISAYEKNNRTSDLKAEDVDQYLDLYALFRMRLQEGYDTGIASTQEFKQEFNNYKEQLINSFVYDRVIEEQLIEEALQRSKEERLLAHILLSVDRPQDSVLVKQRADSLYQAIEAGQITFEQAASQYSNDNASAANNGLVGYVSAMNIVYEVENALYATKVGSISQPFQSPFGYHIVKNLDIRPSQGKVQVAQILIPLSDGLALAENVLMQLKQGSDFNSLVKLYSKDAFSVSREGVLEPFGVGVMQESFEQAAFNLQKPGDISEVITTDYGFHILKLIQRVPLPNDEELRKTLSPQIHRDGRSKYARQTIFENLLQKYHYQLNETEYKKLKDQFLLGTTKEFNIQDYTENKNVLFKLNNKTFTVADLMQDIQSKTNGRVLGARYSFFDQMFKSFQEQLIIQYEAADLERNHNAFNHLLKEYQDGMIIFNVMEANVWNVAQNNEETLHQFYLDRASEYTFGPGFEGVVYTGDTRADLQALKERLSTGQEFQQALNEIDGARGVVRFKRDIGKFNYTDFSNVAVSQMSNSSFSEIFQLADGRYQMIFVNQQIPEVIQEDFSEIKGNVSLDFQKYVENQWTEALKKKYPLKVNQKVLKTIYQ